MNLFRAFIAGTVVPTIILPIALLLAIKAGKSPLLQEPLLHFIPLIWGVWNLLYIAICKNILPGGETVRYALAGAILGLLIALAGVFLLDIPQVAGIEQYRLYLLFIAPICYAILWAFIVRPLNRLLGVKE